MTREGRDRARNLSSSRADTRSEGRSGYSTTRKSTPPSSMFPEDEGGKTFRENSGALPTNKSASSSAVAVELAVACRSILDRCRTGLHFEGRSLGGRDSQAGKSCFSRGANFRAKRNSFFFLALAERSRSLHSAAGVDTVSLVPMRG